MTSTLDRLTALISREGGLVPGVIRPDDALDEGLGLDSCARMALMVEAEAEFGVLITDADEGAVVTVADMAALIDRLRLPATAGSVH